MHSYNLYHSIVYCCHYFRTIALPPNIILLPFSRFSFSAEYIFPFKYPFPNHTNYPTPLIKIPSNASIFPILFCAQPLKTTTQKA